MPDGLSVSSEAGGSAAATTSPEASTAPQGAQAATPAAVAPPPDVSRMSPKQRVMAAIKAGRLPGGPAGESAATEPTPAAAAAAEPTDPVEAKVAAVAAKLEAKRTADREAAEKAKTEASAAELDARIAAARLDPSMLRSPKGREHLKAWSQATGIDPIELFDALEELGESQAADANANPLEKRLSAIEKDKAAEDARKAAEAKAQRESSARETFIATVTADKFPLLSALGEDEIMDRGIAAARMLAESGEDADAETIAALCEVELRKLQSKLAAGGGKKKTVGSTEPRTLSGSLGGETPEPPPFVPGEAGRKARAKAYLARLGK